MLSTIYSISIQQLKMLEGSSSCTQTVAQYPVLYLQTLLKVKITRFFENFGIFSQSGDQI